MCFSSPSAPSPPPPPPPQPVKQVEKVPEQDVFKDKNRRAASGGMSAGRGSTLLTGPGGVSDSNLTLQRKTLLGG